MMASTAPDLDFLTKREVAELLKVSEVTVSRWIKQGRLPSYRVGPRAVRVRRSDVEGLAQLENGRPELTPIDQVAADDWRAPLMKPMTVEERERALQWLQETSELGAEISARRGGRPFDTPIEDIIREEREKRSRQIDIALGWVEPTEGDDALWRRGE